MPPPTRHVDALVAFQSSPRQTRQSVRDSVVIKLFESVCSSSSRLQLHTPTHTHTQSSVYTSVECLTGTGNRGEEEEELALCRWCCQLMLISLSPPLAWLSFNTQSDRETETKQEKGGERGRKRQTDWLADNIYRCISYATPLLKRREVEIIGNLLQSIKAWQPHELHSIERKGERNCLVKPEMGRGYTQFACIMKKDCQK